jgi:hypothetical protein
MTPRPIPKCSRSVVAAALQREPALGRAGGGGAGGPGRRKLVAMPGAAERAAADLDLVVVADPQGL